ncbi:hypothetical protein HF325_006064 [Metschnikowia pulcherrima]|uniref:Skg3/CAF120-like PH-like domain-containing protein n=1 Tax=Metschnikowia pulcherrima TaxID=27326 RepID=A0A8H7GLR9_9ASCO|nr:hypothetical protein HF325_006064 [Metschnikowia pulcherrima]
MVSLSMFKLFRRKKTALKQAPAVPPKKMAAQTAPAPAPAPESMGSPPDAAEGKQLPILPNLIVPGPPTPPSQDPLYPSLVDDYAVSEEAGLAASQEAKLRPPALNTDQPVFSAPTSPVSRRLSLSRHPRASFVRHLRVLSGTSTIAGGLNSMFSPLQALRHRQKTIITDLPPELLPVVNLSNAQRLREYVNGSIGILTEDGQSWLTADASLTGTELSIWILGHSKPRYLNIQDCSIVPSKVTVPGDDNLHDLLILQDYDFNVTSLRFGDVADMHMWLAAMQLSKFEHTSLNEAFTAVVLSLKGPQLSDIYTLLAHKKRFTRFEWCNLRLPQISNKWIKVFMAIVPGDQKRKGRVEMYTSEKLTKKNLILYVNDLSSVYNVYPEAHHMIDFNLIMKLEGEAFVNKLYEHLFSGYPTPSSPKPRSRPSSVTSFGSFNPPTPVQATGTRSRSTSVNSTSSFFNQALPPNPQSPVTNPGSPTTKSKHFFKKQAVNNFVTTNYLYLMPEAHPGVSAIEIMLRNFVHIIDAFKLYGRPEHLNSDKEDPVSMLFGLPALPHFGYLDIEDAYGVVAANFDTARLQNWGQGDWRSCLKEYLSCKQKDEEFKGIGNIYELFNSVDVESDEGNTPDGAISPIPLVTKMQSLQRDTSPSKLRNAQSFQDFQRIVDDGNSSHYSAENESAEGLGKPIELRKTPRSYNDVSNGANGYNSSRSRTLHPIVDLPTPIDDAHAASYFSKEGQIPLQL